METKLKLNANTVLCRLRYENGYIYEGEIMETYLTKGHPPNPLVYEKWPDRRIYGYGKLTQPSGKWSWANGRQASRIPGSPFIKTENGYITSLDSLCGMPIR